MTNKQASPPTALPTFKASTTKILLHHLFKICGRNRPVYFWISTELDLYVLLNDDICIGTSGQYTFQKHISSMTVSLFEFLNLVFDPRQSGMDSLISDRNCFIITFKYRQQVHRDEDAFCALPGTVQEMF